MSWQEFLARFLLGSAVGFVVWVISEAIDKPLLWWVAWLIGLALVFLGEWVGGLGD